MDIEKIDLKGADHFESRCEARVGAEVHTESAVVNPETRSIREGTSLALPRLTFRFQSTRPEASLRFTFLGLDLNGAPDRTELGSCLVPLILPDSSSDSEELLPTPSQRQVWVPQSKQIHVALVGSRIAGTELSRYVGKLRFMVIKRASTPQPNRPRTRVPSQSGSFQRDITLASTPTPTVTGTELPTRDSAKIESPRSTRVSLRSFREEMATPECTSTPANTRTHTMASVQSPTEVAETETQDFLELRRENQSLRRENEQLKTLTHKMDGRASVQSLKSLPKDDLIRRVRELEEELIAESENARSYQDKVQHLQNVLIKQNEIEVQYIKLQEAHTAQQNLVQQLQSKIRKYKQCSQLCQQQEGVVTQLESLLAQQAQGQQGNADLLSERTKENAQLRRELQRFRESDSELISAALRERDDTIRSLKVQLSETARKLELNIAEGSRTQLGLEQRLIVAEKRVQTLMAEIQQNASKWAREKACYEMQLEELRNS